MYNRKKAKSTVLCGRCFFVVRKGVIALLNPKQEAFCLHYAKTGNATESYKIAGYSAKTDRAVYANANRLLKNDGVRDRLKELADEMKSEKIASIAEIQERLTAIMRGEVQEDQIVVEGCGDGVSEAKNMYREVQMKDRLKAGELLAKMQGAFDRNIKLEVTVPVFGDEERLED